MLDLNPTLAACQQTLGTLGLLLRREVTREQGPEVRRCIQQQIPFPITPFLRPVLHAVKLWQHPAYKSSPGLAEQALTALQQPTLLTGVVPAPEALGLTQGLRVPVHVALGALLLLWGYGNVLAPHVCPLGDVLRGTAGRGRLPDQLARAILIDAH